MDWQKTMAERPVRGSGLNSGSPIVAELMAASGFDFVCVDVEHSAVDLSCCQVLFQAIASGQPGCAPLVRLRGVDYAETKRYLDAGARGVIGPLVRSPEETELLVRAVKYPPLGERGVGFCRANAYGRRVDDEFAAANTANLVGVQIEHREAVERIDEILAVPGIDVAFIGPYDLTASLGITADFVDPRYLEACERVLEACRQHGVVAGVHVVQPDPDELRTRIRDGYRFLAYSLDITMLMQACDAGVKTFRNAIANAD